jgi:large subunit ribosomal protein L31
MKKDIHPASYRTVVFKDISTDDAVLGKYYINSKETITWEDGKDYALVKMEISSLQPPVLHRQDEVRGHGRSY